MFALVCLLTACAEVPVAPVIVAAMRTAEMAIEEADRNGVNGYPSPMLVEARNKLREARTAVETKQMTLALQLAQESQIDAELASAKATVIKEQNVNTHMEKSIDSLKQEMNRNEGEIQ